jgi:hypothetical protein
MRQFRAEKAIPRIRFFARNGVGVPPKKLKSVVKTKVLEPQNVQISKVDRIAPRLTAGHVNAR